MFSVHRSSCPDASNSLLATCKNAMSNSIHIPSCHRTTYSTVLYAQVLNLKFTIPCSLFQSADVLLSFRLFTLALQNGTLNYKNRVQKRKDLPSLFSYFSVSCILYHNRCAHEVKQCRIEKTSGSIFLAHLLKLPHLNNASSSLLYLNSLQTPRNIVIATLAPKTLLSPKTLQLPQSFKRCAELIISSTPHQANVKVEYRRSIWHIKMVNMLCTV